MTVGATEEIIVYVLAFAQAVSVGLISASASSSRHRSALYVAGLLMIGVTVVAGFVLGARAPWIGPIFAIVAAVTGTLAAARSLGDDPAMRGESYGQRIVFVLSRRSNSRDDDDENAS
ncbi:hypothetical protein [Microbacterium sp. WCS2018Hpa-9]|uniref:hypothetical protein n=1 Tax=Microbacterium sp. WCS2018Hpa-9 TaxID=3073635 RepID=UPI00288B53CA|nr:hypothetical protein [Microbacterium sp. WCS2018Hpa-9]